MDNLFYYILKNLNHKIFEILLSILYKNVLSNKHISQVEKFKRSFSSFDSLHAKYNSRNCQTVVGDRLVEPNYIIFLQYFCIANYFLKTSVTSFVYLVPNLFWIVIKNVVR